MTCEEVSMMCGRVCVCVTCEEVSVMCGSKVEEVVTTL